MRSFRLFSLLIVMLVQTGISQDQKKEVGNGQRLLGAWELVSADYGSGNKPIGDVREPKLITLGHFVWVRYDRSGNTLGEGGGSYTFTQSTMVEHLEFTDKRENFLNNKDQTVQITFPNEKILISSGVLSSGQHINEVWNESSRSVCPLRKKSGANWMRFSSAWT